MEVYRNKDPIRTSFGTIRPGSLIAQEGDRVVGFAESVDTGFFKGWLAWRTDYTPRGLLRMTTQYAHRFPNEAEATSWLNSIVMTQEKS